MSELLYCQFIEVVGGYIEKFLDSLHVPGGCVSQATAASRTDGSGGERVLTSTKTAICPAADLL